MSPAASGGRLFYDAQASLLKTVATLTAMTSTVFQLGFVFIALGVLFAGGGVFPWGWRQIMG